jgi:serine/threonine-protein kinase RsbW
MINELRVSLAPELSDIGNLFRMIETFGEANDLPEPKVYVVNLMLDELVTNLVMHGNSNGETLTADIRLQLGKGGITLTVADDGQPFDPTAAETPDVNAALEDRQVGKLGLHFVKSLADEVSYRLENGWNLLTINVETDTKE